MKLSPEEKQAMDRMAPGVYCRDGFLGTDTRRLSVILDTDRSALAQLDVTPQRVADALQDILNAAMAAYGAPVEVAGGMTARFTEAMGRIPSPFGDGVFPKGEVELTALDGNVIHFTPLSVHMIAQQGFFQGHGSRYRLEPADLVRLLGLQES